MMKTFICLTLGCKVNSYESEAVRLLMLEAGFSDAGEDNVDIIIINTCSVTVTSEKKTRQLTRRYGRNYPHALIVLMGCYAQISSAFLATLEQVKIVVGTNNRHLIPSLIKQYLIDGQPQILIEQHQNKPIYEPLSVTSYIDQTRAYIKIQDGCDNFCTYCIIPYTRGRLRSRNANEIIIEIGKLLDHGFQELVLTGIHTAGYGRDFENMSFDDLISSILANFPNLYRLRISSIEESEISERFLMMLEKEPRLARHLHIPLQSGSDHILKLMNRHYNQAQFLDKVLMIKHKLPRLALTTDVIVGFPGETEQDFNDTINVIKQIGFAKIHVFPYSPRSGTRAENFAHPVAGKIIQQRVQTLLTLSSQLEEEYANQFIGKALEVIIEKYNYQKAAYEGHSSNYLKVYVMGHEQDQLKGKVISTIYQGNDRLSPIEKIVR